MGTQRAQQGRFWPLGLVTELVDALESRESALCGWVDVAENRLALIETLRVELRQAKHEVERLQGLPSNIENLTRVVVVKNSHITTEAFAGSWDAYLQDEGRTLKLFGTGNGHAASYERDAALAQDLVEILVEVCGRDRECRRYCNGCGAAFVGEHDCKRVIP